MRSESAIASLASPFEKMEHHHDQYLKNIPSDVNFSDFQPREGDKQRTWGERVELIQAKC